jgi:hypothetical protein
MSSGRYCFPAGDFVRGSVPVRLVLKQDKLPIASVTVPAPYAMLADGLPTAFMVRGARKSHARAARGGNRPAGPGYFRFATLR